MSGKIISENITIPENVTPVTEATNLEQYPSQLVSKRKELICYYQHVEHQRLYRLELRQDLLNTWVVVRYVHSRRFNDHFSTYLDAKIFFDDIDRLCQRRHYVKLIEKNFQEIATTEPGSMSPSSESGPHLFELQKAAEEFTENTDWVDISNCFSLSADEFADQNWRRFQQWLHEHWGGKNPALQALRDPDIYQFALCVWSNYRKNLVI
ncbi:MAG: hypothetical protein V4629_02715 [Pseudomonadota bacterium]